jgi:hypothetical protein
MEGNASGSLTTRGRQVCAAGSAQKDAKADHCKTNNQMLMQVPSRYLALQHSNGGADTAARPDQQGKLSGNSLSALPHRAGSLAKQGGGSLGDAPRRVPVANPVGQHGGKQNPGLKPRVPSSFRADAEPYQPVAPVTLPAQPQNQPVAAVWEAPAAAPASPVPGDLVPAIGSARKGGSTYSGLHKARLQHHAALSPAVGGGLSYDDGRDMSAATMLSFTAVSQGATDTSQSTAPPPPAGAYGSQGSSKVQDLVSRLTAAQAKPFVPPLNLKGFAPTPFTAAQQAATQVQQRAAAAEVAQTPSSSAILEPQVPMQAPMPAPIQRASSGGISHSTVTGSPSLPGSRAASRLHTSLTGSLGGGSAVLSTGSSSHPHPATGSSGGMKPLPQGSWPCIILISVTLSCKRCASFVCGLMHEVACEWHVVEQHVTAILHWLQWRIGGSS